MKQTILKEGKKSIEIYSGLRGQCGGRDNAKTMRAGIGRWARDKKENEGDNETKKRPWETDVLQLRESGGSSGDNEEKEEMRAVNRRGECALPQR